ncbi:MAG: pitrilysin family protein [Myxococcales bacterium]|nr:insulinase family protein [Polyangiaceae bacterium]MDW8249550.1 pitrilysin family protein [Myxococcales bacterium]
MILLGRSTPLLTLAAMLLACSANPEPILVPLPPSSAEMPPASSVPPTIDPLGERPVVADPGPFVPPVPEVFEGPAGSKIWLLERHGLPLVSLVALVPHGASSDGKFPGRAYLTADMLDEGTDQLDAVAFSRALEDLGAQLRSSADREKSSVTLEVLSSKFSEALVLLGAAITRPRHAEADWKRVSALWKNALKARGDDPSTVARLVTSAVLWGEEHPYGRPAEGTIASARHLSLREVARWHKILWHPQNVTFVVVGDVSQAKLIEELNRAFEGWKAAPSRVEIKVDFPALPPTPRTVLVDRPDAPQVVMTVARRSASSGNPELPLLELINIALGGSFTSRLNQNLREDHGWTYGARSTFAPLRQGGMFLARASIHTDAIEAALRETLAELKKMADEGPSAEEITKSKALARADAVETYGSLQAIAAALASSAAQGLPADHDARALAAQGSATREALLPLARRAFSPDEATILLVGPRKAVEAALQANGLPAPEERDTEGRLVRRR